MNTTRLEPSEDRVVGNITNDALGALIRAVRQSQGEDSLLYAALMELRDRRTAPRLFARVAQVAAREGFAPVDFAESDRRFEKETR